MHMSDWNLIGTSKLKNTQIYTQISKYFTPLITSIRLIFVRTPGNLTPKYKRQESGLKWGDCSRIRFNGVGNSTAQVDYFKTLPSFSWQKLFTEYLRLAKSFSLYRIEKVFGQKYLPFIVSQSINLCCLSKIIFLMKIQIHKIWILKGIIMLNI